MPLVTRRVCIHTSIPIVGVSWTRQDCRGRETFIAHCPSRGLMRKSSSTPRRPGNHFECKTLGEYSILYLKIGVLLLADVFENFRDLCMKTYNLNAAYYQDSVPIKRIYEVDISYPRHLDDKHNDLPFLTHNSIPTGSKVKKLIATFEKKENYIMHYTIIGTCNRQLKTV